MSSISSQQLWIVNFQLWILWLPFELLPRILDVPRTFLRRILNVPWMYLESIFCLATIFLPSCYLLSTFFLPSSYPLYCIYQKNISYHNCSLKNSAFINSELIWFFNFQFSTFNSSLSIVNCPLNLKSPDRCIELAGAKSF